MIKTFRGLLADDGQDRIRLSTIKGKVGYKIIKLQLITNNPGASATVEHIVKVYKTEQSTIDGVINFTDSDLLATGFYSATPDPTEPGVAIVIFDTEIFNQDIYITQKDLSVGLACNYYLELEVVPLDDAGAEYTTLKDMRST